MSLIVLVIGILTFVLWVFVFILHPFRPVLIIFVYSLFSFILRPLAVSFCDDFTSFYYFTESSYELGILIANTSMFLYMIGYVIALRRTKQLLEIDLVQIKRIATHLSIYALFIITLAILIYGNAILPGFRSTGLSKAAPGSQIFFAVFSILIVPAIALRILVLAIEDTALFKRMRSIFIIGLLMAVSMLFYQRGPAIQAVGLGLYFAVLATPKAKKKKFLKFGLILVLMGLVVIQYGRPLVSLTIRAIYNTEHVTSSFGHIERTTSCKIAMMGSQEHDQVWPSVIDYVDQNGPDLYYNFLAAIMRPFLTAEERNELNLRTSVDTLNIFNNEDVYLEKNFGFSITLWQYHYFAIGIMVIPLSMILGFFSARLENKIEQTRRLNLPNLIYVLGLLQIIILINSAVDERLKWVIMTLIIISGAYLIQRIKLTSIRV